MNQAPNYYGGSRLDRAATRRRDEVWVAATLAHPESRLVPVWRDLSFVTGDRCAPRIPLLAVADPWWRELAGPEPLMLLGQLDGAVWFGLDLSALEAPESLPALAGQGGFIDLRSVGRHMPLDEAAICAYARGMSWWHRRHRFCGVCGHPTTSLEAGHLRRCGDPACGTVHFPRTDPAVIMLVTDGQRCLLGRQPRFAPGVYSTLAGFVEPGESLEDAVAREVLEETGIEVGDIRYHSSQPWPFPSSLMLGFYAHARTTEIRIDGIELEDARWFERSWLLANRDAAVPRPPRPDSIARRLLEDWLAG
ncbi:MAG: NAD(+) diphosphatase [Azospirillum sp.]|nr:NAD(+) diphosphatase [Azospirillum sp.]